MPSRFYENSKYKLWVLLSRTTDAILKAREKELRQIGTAPMQAAILFIVHALRKNAIPAEISRWFIREPHSISTLISRMEKRGLLSKTNDLKRKNLVRVSLTKKGLQLASLSMKSEVLTGIFSSLSEDQQQQLTSILNTLMDKAVQHYGIARPRLP